MLKTALDTNRSISEFLVDLSILAFSNYDNVTAKVLNLIGDVDAELTRCPFY
jgi:hypothetical protein